jgi:hypothetical protein
LVNFFKPTCKLEVLLIFGAYGGSYMHNMMYDEVFLDIFDQMLKKLIEEITPDT